MTTRCLLALLFALSLQAQTNFDLEKGTDSTAPEAWFAPAFFKDFKVVWASNSCAKGTGCADLTPVNATPAGPGNLMQSFDATPYRGKRIRYRAAVSTSGNAHAGLWLRVDRMTNTMGFFENMQAKPIRTEGQWKYFEIDGFVHTDAKAIALGILAYNGPVRFDDASITATGELPPMVTEGPRPLTAQGLRNLEAFTNLYGIVRHFHPSDQVAAADWNLIAIEGVRKVENTTDLNKTLLEIFLPVAPTLRVFTGEPPAQELAKTDSLIRMQHNGFGQATANFNAYTSKRIPAESLSYYSIPIGQGLTAIVPLSLYKDETGTLPRAAKPADAVPISLFDASDRATRLGAVIIAWNIFQHFYPYFDVAATDWKAILPVTLNRAATDADGFKFQSTLGRMVAALKDGHGSAYYASTKPLAHAPVWAEWIENKYIVTTGTYVIKPGDEIVAINGKPAGQRLSELEEEISSATPQWARSRSSMQALSGDRGTQLTLTVREFHTTETKEFTVTCDAPLRQITDNRPSTTSAEIEPGIWYVDLTRATDKDFTELLPKLEKATGIVFDIRGYPKVTPAWFNHVSKTPVASAHWDIPLIDRPGHMEFNRTGWTVPPKAPYLEAKKVFLTDGSAISYAETTMGMIEHYKLGEILGGTTAGTNGNVNPVQLPGGMTVYWTGMKVTKHDGTRHHGVGIKPTSPVSRTQAGVATGRDEVLERAIATLKSKP